MKGRKEKLRIEKSDWKRSKENFNEKDLVSKERILKKKNSRITTGGSLKRNREAYWNV